MDPDRKRKIRLGVALGAAVLLAAGLAYTSFSASTEAKQPSELLAAGPGKSYEVTGVVVADSIQHEDAGLNFEIADRDNPAAKVPVTYQGEVPDPFADNREVIVTGQLKNGTLVAQRDSLITKCPSKFADQAARDPEHVVITPQ